MALFGSDVEKKIKAAAADGEPQWDGAGLKPGLQIWRIESFKVKPWPESKYGQFHTGDSYIVLHTYIKDPEVNPDKLAWNVHFWIGSESSQDEYGTAAYKTVELDDKLGGAAVQHREVESSESDLFCGHFPKGVRYLKGGVATGFKHVEDPATREPVLLRIKGTAGNMQLRQVRLKRTYMNSGDVFVMDTVDALWQWNGAEASAHEKSKAAELCRLLQADDAARKYREIHVLDEGSPDGDGTAKEFKYKSNHGFWKHLPGQRKFLGISYASISIKSAEAGGDDARAKAFAPALFYASASASGTLQLKSVWKGDEPPINRLRTDKVCFFDNGFQCYIWAGKAAPRQDRTSAFPFAQDYLKRYKRPAVLPITRFNEGIESTDFKRQFGPPEPPGCCASCAVQ